MDDHVANGHITKREKPLMEKRRRARINESLARLKLLVLGEVRRKSTRLSKLDKADILEMTVEYVNRVTQTGNTCDRAGTRVDKYRVGFNACADEVWNFLSSNPEVDIEMRTRVTEHLASFIQNVQWLKVGRHSDKIDIHRFLQSGKDNRANGDITLSRQSKGQSTCDRILTTATSVSSTHAPSVHYQPVTPPFNSRSPSHSDLPHKHHSTGLISSISSMLPSGVASDRHISHQNNVSPQQDCHFVFPGIYSYEHNIQKQFNMCRIHDYYQSYSETESSAVHPQSGSVAMVNQGTHYPAPLPVSPMWRPW